MPGLAIEKLKNDLVAMGEMAESAVDTAIMALVDRDADLACFVIDDDKAIDEMELSVDQRCIDLLGDGKLHGANLRFVTAGLKINNDLERIGDLAVGICEHVLFLIREKTVLSQIIDLQEVLEQISQMVRESVEAVVASDIDLAWKIIDERKIVDDEIHMVFREIIDVMQTDARTIERCCHLQEILHHLHRVADQASNIAEEVIFIVEGVTVRHHLREFHPIAPMPFGPAGTREAEESETAVLHKRKTRAQIRKEHAEAKRVTKTISREEMVAQAAAAAPKVKQAREKLLKLRASKNKASNG